MEILDRKSFKILDDEIRAMGEFAKEKQKNIHRSFKDDGSVLTETDLAISTHISEMVHELFPDCNMISEEEKSAFNPDAPFTFILDPIDGTDMYSQGMSTFAIALGILDRNRQPVGGIVDAPRCGIGRDFLHASRYPNEEVYLDGEVFTPTDDKDHVREIMCTGHELSNYDYSNYHGKLRSFGSSILHALLPAFLKDTQACLTQPCYAWDIAASHAIIKGLGMDVSYMDGRLLEYTDEMLVERKTCEDSIFTGTDAAREQLSKLITRGK